MDCSDWEQACEHLGVGRELYEYCQGKLHPALEAVYPNYNWNEEKFSKRDPFQRSMYYWTHPIYPPFAGFAFRLHSINVDLLPSFDEQSWVQN